MLFVGATARATGGVQVALRALGRQRAAGKLGVDRQPRAAGGDQPAAAKRALRARKVLEWPRRCKLAHAFRWECS